MAKGRPKKGKGARITIASSEELKRLIDALAGDIMDAHIHADMFLRLQKRLSESPQVIAQSNTFWQLTLKAHHETALSCLCRAFDQQKDALHLKSWLETIRANLHLFAEPNFRERLKGNAFVDSLAATPRVPDLATLNSDIALCSKPEPLISKLLTYRNHSLAHQNAKRAVEGRAYAPTEVLTGVEVEWLLDRADTILNRYSSMFSASTFSRGIIGRDDYGYVIDAVAERVQRSRTENERLLRELPGE